VTELASQQVEKKEKQKEKSKVDEKVLNLAVPQALYSASMLAVWSADAKVETLDAYSVD
jgi:hypothetical protein